MAHKMWMFASGADEFHGGVTDRALFRGPVMTTYIKARTPNTQHQRRFLAIARRRRELKENQNGLVREHSGDV